MDFAHKYLNIHKIIYVFIYIKIEIYIKYSFKMGEYLSGGLLSSGSYYISLQIRAKHGPV